MTAATETNSAAESIPTTAVDVDGIDGPVGEDQLADLTKGLLEKVIRACDAVPPKRAARDELERLARNALRLRAMTAVDAQVRQVDQEQADEALLAEHALVAPTAEERGLIPNGSQFEQIVKMADYLSRSNLTPDALRGKPNDVGAVLLRAWDLGISQSAAMESLYVIKGKVGMEGKLMAALIRRGGHSLRVSESDGQHAVWYGRRADNDDEGFGSFSLDEAQQAGLIKGIKQDGTVDPHGDKKVWQSYTKAMLKWRALAVLARDLFSDCIAGVSYLPEELGYIDVEAGDQLGGSGKAGASEQTMTLNQQRSELAARIAEMDEDLRAELREEWKRRGLKKPDDLSPGAIRTARGLIETAETKQREREAAEQDGIDEAEVVEDETGDASTAEGGGAGDDTVGETDASPAPATEEDLTEFCAGCNEPIPDTANPVYDDEERPWHSECAGWL